MTRFLILGAGPAGLTFANRLKQIGVNDFLVLEKEQEAGGLCRSREVDGAPLDIGGGHFLDVKRPKVNQFLFNFLPKDEWNQYNRDSRICLNNRLINHPIEANIWQLQMETQIEYLKSIAAAGCNLGTEKPQDFISWIYWKLGCRIAEDYMIPYNQKMFGNDLNELGTYWMDKLPNVSFEDTLRSCLERKPYGKEPGHAQFYYPKRYGYGEVWRRMAYEIKDKIQYNERVKGIDINNKIVFTQNRKFRAENIITTIPWMELKEIIGMPESIRMSINGLKHTSIQVEYHDKKIDSDAHWIYYPDLDIPYHRILVRHNFCPGSKGYWTETNSGRTIKSNTDYTYISEYAYPLNTKDKPRIMNQLLSWGKENKLYGLGRWGEHMHYNSDVTVELAMQMAESLVYGKI